MYDVHDSFLTQCQVFPYKDHKSCDFTYATVTVYENCVNSSIQHYSALVTVMLSGTGAFTKSCVFLLHNPAR